MSVYCTTCGNQVSLTAGHTCYQKELNVLLCEIPSHAKLEARIAYLWRTLELYADMDKLMVVPNEMKDAEQAKIITQVLKEYFEPLSRPARQTLAAVEKIVNENSEENV